MLTVRPNRSKHRVDVSRDWHGCIQSFSPDNILLSVIQFREDLMHPRDGACADPRGVDMNAYFIAR